MNALAVFFGFAPPERAQGALDALERPETEVRQAEPFYCFFVLGALGRGGRAGAALRLLRGRFGPMLDQGPGTIWENWRGKTVWEEGVGVEWVSLCHAFSCAMLYFYPAQTLGVEPLADGFARFRCAPKPGGLEFAQGVIPAPVGGIDVSWVDDDTRFSLSLGVPLAQTECQVELPCRGTVTVTDVGGNEYPLGALRRLGPGRYTIIVRKRRD